MSREDDQLHVVFGATGALGSAIVRELASQGKPVRAVTRHGEYARRLLPSSAEIVEGDVMAPDRAVAFSRGASVIYHCVNLPYSQWVQYMPQVTDNILEGAGRAGAKLLFPGDVYVYGPFQQIPATEEHPHAATTKKGRLRISLESRLMEAHRAGRVPVVIPRFPDFYGPNVTNPLVAPVFEAALQGKTAGWPGSLEVPHDMVYIDDAAVASVLLANTESAYGQDWLVPGAGPLTARQFITMAYQAAGAVPKMRAMGQILFRFVGVFIPDAGEMVELLYLFQRPQQLDGTKFARAFPSFEYTPHEIALQRTVEWFRRRVVR